MNQRLLKMMETVEWIQFKTRLVLGKLRTKTWHRIRCVYWNWRLPKDLNLYLQRWEAIDHRKDKSLSGSDFRFWYYLTKLK